MLVGLAMTLLLAGWVMSSVPFSGPDEAAHYLRALSIANGSLVGPRAPIRNAALTTAQSAWVTQDARGVLVPARLSPPDIACLAGTTDRRSRCVEPSGTGDYPPLPYLLPALALSAASHTGTALWAARVANLVPNVGFIMLAIALMSGGTTWAMVGLLAALTPMVLFVGSILSPSGLETASGLAFLAGLLRLVRPGVHPPPWVWIALAASGATLVLSEHLGPAFALVDSVLVAALLGGTGLRALLAEHGRGVAGVGLGLGAALGLYVAYGVSAGLFHSHIDFSPLRSSLHMGLVQLGPVIHDGVGVFGGLTIRLPAALYWIWWLLVLVIVGVALRGARHRERLVVGLAALVLVAFPVLLYAGVYRSTGFGMQGRQVLPVLALLPLLAGESISRSGRRATQRRGRWLAAGAVGAIAVFQMTAWWINARTAAGEPRAFWFLGHPAWSPPLGWWPWTALTLAGTLVLLGAAIRQLGRVVDTDVAIPA